MLIWSGSGILSILVFIISLFICSKTFPSDYSDYAFIFSFFIAGIFSGVLGKELNKKAIITDKSGQRKIVENQHTLFWMPMQYWGIIFPCLGIFILLQNSIVLAAIASLIFGGIIFFHNNDYDTTVFNPIIEKKISNSPKVKMTSTLEKKSTISALKEVANLPKRKTLTDMTEAEQTAYLQKYMPK